MSKGVFLGVSDVARKAKKMFAGVDDTARTVKKAWVGVGGVARPCFSSSELEYWGEITTFPANDLLAIGRAGELVTVFSDSPYGYVEGYRFMDNMLYDSYGSTYTRSYMSTCSLSSSLVMAEQDGDVRLFEGGDGLATTLAPLRWDRGYPAALVLADHAVFAGGSPAEYDEDAASGMFSVAVDCYDGNGVCVYLSPLDEARWFTGHTCIGEPLLESVGVVFGGRQKNGQINIDAYHSDFTKAAIAQPLSDHFDIVGQGIATVGGRIVLSGGEYYNTRTKEQATMREAYTYDEHLVFQQVASMQEAHCWGASVSAFGQALWIGGSYEPGIVEAFDDEFTCNTIDVYVKNEQATYYACATERGLYVACCDQLSGTGSVSVIVKL